MKLSLPTTGFCQLEFLYLLQATAIPRLSSQSTCPEFTRSWMGKDLSELYTGPWLFSSCLPYHPHLTTPLALPFWAPASMPYFHLFDPHSLCSAWNVPSSLPIELPTHSLILASLFKPLLNLVCLSAYLGDYWWMSSLSASRKARTIAGCAHWMGFHSF